MRVRFPLALVLLLPLLAAAYRAPTPPPGIVSGRVTDADGGPLADANALLLGTALGAATDADGRFAIPGVPEGRYELQVSLTGYAPQTVALKVAAGGADPATVALERAPAEAGEVAERERDDATARPRPVSGVGEEGSVEMDLDAEADGIAFSMAPPPAMAPSPSAESAAPSGAARRAAPAGGDVLFDAPYPHPPRPRHGQAGILTAGDVDDGLNWEAFLGYVRRTLDAHPPQGDANERRMREGQVFPDLGLDDRVTLQVEDRSGDPVAGARVRVEADGGSRAKRLITETGTDGRLALFPGYDFGPGTKALRLEVRRPGGEGRAVEQTVMLGALDEDRAVRVRLPLDAAERPAALDLAFVIDATGSMGDELRYLTAELRSIVARVERAYPGVDLRFGLVAYRDQGDQFVVRRHDFTRSADEMQRRLAGLHAGGGGDYPEAMDEALEAALELDWRTGTAARVAFLVADAPPHDDRVGRTLDAVREARARGLRLYPVAASGVADQAEYVMRAAAVLTQARHLFLTDDSGVGNSHAEPKIPCYEVTALDGLLARVIEGELAGRRIGPDADEVIRSVGQQQDGVCAPRAVAQREEEQRGELGYE